MAAIGRTMSEATFNKESDFHAFASCGFNKINFR